MQGEGDVVTATAQPDLPAGQIVIDSITGDDGRLSLEAGSNCVGIAALETLKLRGEVDCGISLSLDKVYHDMKSMLMMPMELPFPCSASCGLSSVSELITFVSYPCASHHITAQSHPFLLSKVWRT